MSKWIWTVIACVAVAAVAFFGGVFVGRLTASTPGGGGRQGFGAFGQGGQNAQNRAGGFASGTVLKKDASGSFSVRPDAEAARGRLEDGDPFLDDAVREVGEGNQRRRLGGCHGHRRRYRGVGRQRDGASRDHG
jgi:hypothetical protein